MKDGSTFSALNIFFNVQLIFKESFYYEDSTFGQSFTFFKTEFNFMTITHNIAF